jgi:hypothetical protein
MSPRYIERKRMMHEINETSPIKAEEIANALAKICRFGGQSRDFYSVAEHSVHLSKIVQSLGMGLELEYQAMVHDAAEMMLGDILSPAKRLLTPAVNDLEEAILKRACADLGVSYPIDTDVKYLDKVLADVEKEWLMGGMQTAIGAGAIGGYILPAKPLEWQQASRMWIRRWRQLACRHVMGVLGAF